MGWQDLLQKEDETIVVPWFGGREICTFDRTWYIKGHLPQEHGWHEFATPKAREARWVRVAEPVEDLLQNVIKGYLVGDRLVPDDVKATIPIENLAKNCEPVVLVEQGLDRFQRISAGRSSELGPLVFKAQEFPLGPEDEVLEAFLSKKDSVDNIKTVVPALDTAFRVETWRRAVAERIRAEEEEKRRREELRKQAEKMIGTAEGRRELAAVDFEQAARAALKVGGAEYLDHRNSYNKHEMVVRFRTINRRFECTCDSKTLRIIDSGICLVDHETGEKGDARFTLESLPAVIREANQKNVLVVFRHVG